MNGDISPREKLKPSVIENHKKDVDRDRNSPRSDSSSHGSSSSGKHNKEVCISSFVCLMYQVHVSTMIKNKKTV